MVLGWGSFAYIPVKLGNKLELGGDPFLRGLVVHVKITTLNRSNVPAVPLSTAGNCLVASIVILHRLNITHVGGLFSIISTRGQQVFPALRARS